MLVSTDPYETTTKYRGSPHLKCGDKFDDTGDAPLFSPLQENKVVRSKTESISYCGELRTKATSAF